MIEQAQDPYASVFDVRVFQPAIVKECIRSVLVEKLTGEEYSPETTPEQTKAIVESIRNKIKDLGYDRYKIIVQVYIGEYKGQGVKVASRKFWDVDTDTFTVDMFTNNSLFCVAMACGVYYY
ncbi:tctex1 domain-containing protein 2-like isoform X1 [Argonauta hians]